MVTFRKVPTIPPDLLDDLRVTPEADILAGREPVYATRRTTSAPALTDDELEQVRREQPPEPTKTRLARLFNEAVAELKEADPALAAKLAKLEDVIAGLVNNAVLT